MVEAYLRRGPLAHRSLPSRIEADGPRKSAAGLWLAWRPHRAQVNLRGDASDAAFIGAVRQAIGIDLPLKANTTSGGGDVKALWLGPDEWLVVARDGREGDLAAALRQALAGMHAAVTDNSEARTVIAIAGPRARELMAKATPLDPHPRVFGPGACAQTVFAKAAAIIDQIDDAPTFELYVLNSFADYLWAWLERAGEEYAIAVVE